MTPIDVDEAARLRRAVNRLVRKFNAASTDGGLSPTEASVLGSVAGRAAIGIAALAEREHINPTMLSRVVRKLDSAGLIVREPHPDDQRAATLSVTARGRELQERILQQRAQLVAAGIAGLMPSERHLLIRALPVLEHLAETVP